MTKPPLLEYLARKMPYGDRADDVLRAAAGLLVEPSLAAYKCAAALLLSDGTIVAESTEIIGREPQRHAVWRAVMSMLRGGERRIALAAVLRREREGRLAMVLPCGACRMDLHPFGGPDLGILHVAEARDAAHPNRELLIVELGQLLPFADGGSGQELPPEFLQKP